MQDGKGSVLISYKESRFVTQSFCEKKKREQAARAYDFLACQFEFGSASRRFSVGRSSPLLLPLLPLSEPELDVRRSVGAFPFLSLVIFRLFSMAARRAFTV